MFIGLIVLLYGFVGCNGFAAGMVALLHGIRPEMPARPHILVACALTGGGRALITLLTVSLAGAEQSLIALG